MSTRIEKSDNVVVVMYGIGSKNQASKQTIWGWLYLWLVKEWTYHGPSPRRSPQSKIKVSLQHVEENRLYNLHYFCFK